MHNRDALIVNSSVTQAAGTVERDGAQAMAVDRLGDHLTTLGANKRGTLICLLPIKIIVTRIALARPYCSCVTEPILCKAD